MKLSNNEIEMILTGLKTEQRTLHNLMNDLERKGFHNGNQNVEIQTRMHELNDLIRKLERSHSITVEPMTV